MLSVGFRWNKFNWYAQNFSILESKLGYNA